jgi:membrane protein DedA with SNARE-associated domain
VTELLLRSGYLALALAPLLAGMGVPTGSELVIALAGALASGKVSGSRHHLALVAVIVVATACELVGSMFGYSIGRIGGRPLLERIGKYALITNHDLDRAERLFACHGQPIAVFGRFVPLVRSFVSPGAGMAKMPIGPFVACTAVATASWCTGSALFGYEVVTERRLTLSSSSTCLVAISLLGSSSS